MNEELITLLKDARLNQISNIKTNLDYPKLYNLANQHQITALIYNQIYTFPGIPENLKQIWKRETFKINAFQTRKTIKMLQVYQQFINNNLKVLIVKGLICRYLYPIPDNRPSNDEDLYIQTKDFLKVKEIFLNNNFQIINETSDVTIFVDYESGLSIELHTALFSLDFKSYGNYQQLFTDAFTNCISHQIENMQVYSLEYSKHLLFLILHFAKHFFHGGVGIRQVVDIIMYSEKYEDKIDWDYLYQVLKDLNLYPLIMNLFALAHDYLEFDYQIPDDVEIDYQDLFNDIMDAGIFGQSSSERIHSATITLNTLEDGKVSVIKSIFPSLKEMQAKYDYLNKYPFLLPIAYLSRIIKYKQNHSSKDGQKTIEIGKQRIELLKKYKVIK